MPLGLENLKIYQIATDLEMAVHSLTKRFPPDERFRSVDQLLRSSSSVTNNIAEAYRRRSLADRELIFRDICCGEVEETRTNLLRCAQKGFCASSEVEPIAQRYHELIKAVYGFLRFLRSKRNPDT